MSYKLKLNYNLASNSYLQYNGRKLQCSRISSNKKQGHYIKRKITIKESNYIFVRISHRCYLQFNWFRLEVNFVDLVDFFATILYIWFSEWSISLLIRYLVLFVELLNVYFELCFVQPAYSTIIKRFFHSHTQCKIIMSNGTGMLGYSGSWEKADVTFDVNSSVVRQ